MTDDVRFQIMSTKKVIAAFTEEQASRLTGITVHQLRYWDKTKLFSPQFAAADRRLAFSRVYSFQDIAALRVLNVLTKQYSVSVQHLRDVARKLCAMDNSAWIRTTLYVLKGRVNFIDPSDGKQREIVSGQYAGSSLNRVGRGFNHKLNILVSAGSAYFLMHA